MSLPEGVTWAALAAFNLTLAAAFVVPGPAFLVAMRATLAEGRRAGLATGAGLAAAASLWTLAAVLGLDALFAVAPWAYGALRSLGAIYLVWIAVQTWRHAGAPLPAVGAAGRGFRRGALVNLGNPKSILFAGAVIVVIFPGGLGPAGMALVVLNQFAVELAGYALFALLFGAPPARRAYAGAKRVIDRLAAGAMGALGARLLLDRGAP